MNIGYRCHRNVPLYVYILSAYSLLVAGRTVYSSRATKYVNKMLSYRRETALQGTLVWAKSGRLELRDNILLIL